MEARKIVMLCGVFILSIMLMVTGAFAIGTPTIVSPKVPFGSSWSYTYNTSRTPTFSWTSVPGATWYQIWVSEKATPGTAVINQWVEAGNSWTSGDVLKPGTLYRWWIRAWNVTEMGLWSAGEDFVVGRIHSLVIGASAFMPYDENYEWEVNGTSLKTGNSSSHSWYAPVTLPDGAAVITLLLFYYNSDLVSTATEASLLSSANNSTSSQTLASVTAGTSSGYNYVHDTTINYATINGTYNYFVRLNLPSQNNYLIQARIDYWD